MLGPGEVQHDEEPDECEQDEKGIRGSLGRLLTEKRQRQKDLDLAHRAKTELVETRYGPQALNQRQTIQSLMQQSLEQIDMFPGLTDLVSVPLGPVGSEAVTDRAFQVWRLTGLATFHRGFEPMMPEALRSAIAVATACVWSGVPTTMASMSF